MGSAYAGSKLFIHRLAAVVILSILVVVICFPLPHHHYLFVVVVLLLLLRPCPPSREALTSSAVASPYTEVPRVLHEAGSTSRFLFPLRPPDLFVSAHSPPGQVCWDGLGSGETQGCMCEMGGKPDGLPSIRTTFK